MKYIELYRKMVNRIIVFIVNNKNSILFSSKLVWYLKSPWYFKLIIGSFFGLITMKLYYTTGFIVLQSKAKNEALSIITAYQNPIEFSDALVYSYSFLFSFIALSTLLPFVVLYGLYIFLKYKNNSNNHEKKLVKRLALVILYLSIFSVTFGFVSYTVPYFAYILLYKSKDASLLEFFVRNMMGEISEIPEIVLLSQEYLSTQIRYSLIIGIWMLIVPILLLIGMKYLSNKRKGKISKLLFNILAGVISFLILLVLMTHTFYITGYFGRSISNFDMDYVRVEFDMNGAQSIEGIRVFEKGNKIIIRDACNVTHNINSDKTHIKTINNFSSGCDN